MKKGINTRIKSEKVVVGLKLTDDDKYVIDIHFGDDLFSIRLPKIEKLCRKFEYSNSIFRKNYRFDKFLEVLKNELDKISIPNDSSRMGRFVDTIVYHLNVNEIQSFFQFINIFRLKEQEQYEKRKAKHKLFLYRFDLDGNIAEEEIDLYSGKYLISSQNVEWNRREVVDVENYLVTLEQTDFNKAPKFLKSVTFETDISDRVLGKVLQERKLSKKEIAIKSNNLKRTREIAINSVLDVSIPIYKGLIYQQEFTSIGDNKQFEPKLILNSTQDIIRNAWESDTILVKSVKIEWEYRHKYEIQNATDTEIKEILDNMRGFLENTVIPEFLERQKEKYICILDKNGV